MGGRIFPSDGWRGVIGRQFTLGFMLSLTEGFLDFANEAEMKCANGIVVGYDTRSLGRECAREMAHRIARRGIKVYLSINPVPTPLVATYAIEYKLDAAIIITASHFPGEYNGVKFRFDTGRPATALEFVRIMELARKYSTKSKDTHIASTDASLTNEIDLKRWYVQFVLYRYRGLLRLLESTGRRNRKIVVDVMHGTTGEILSNILSDIGWVVLEIRADIDPAFGGDRPDPTEPNCRFLLRNVAKHGAALGIAFDGDGERACFVEPELGYVGPTTVPSLALLSLLRRTSTTILKEPYPPCIVKTFPVTLRVDQLAEKEGFSVIEVPVGFRNLHSTVLERDAIGGFGDDASVVLPPYYSKNGVLTSLCVLSLLEDGTLCSHLRRLASEFGELHYFKGQVSYDRRSRAEVFLANFEQSANKWNSTKIIRNENDVKVFLSNSWFLVLLAGTENYIRIYAEGIDRNLVKEKLNSIYSLIRSYKGMEITGSLYTKLN